MQSSIYIHDLAINIFSIGLVYEARISFHIGISNRPGYCKLKAFDGTVVMEELLSNCLY
jgi:hypothetical protein